MRLKKKGKKKKMESKNSEPETDPDFEEITDNMKYF